MDTAESKQEQPAANWPVSHRFGCWLKWCFCGMVLALALFQFSENTADPDLWAHTMFGEQLLLTGKLQRTEPYSWTAPGTEWINHEWLAELAFGTAHLAGGGGGILLFKIVVGLATFGLALRLGGEALAWPQRAVAWGVGAIGVIEISYGFAARPQIFTALFLVVELWLLRKISKGKVAWALGLPVLCVLWINAHGGVLAGMAMMLAAAAAMTAQLVWKRFGPLRRVPVEPISAPAVCAVWLGCAGSAAALLINPWGLELIRWVISEVLYLNQRPELQEWSPTPPGWDHATLFILMALAAVSWGLSRRPRALWELVICAGLALFAIRSVRHTPLFAIAAVAFVPPHLADVLARFRRQMATAEETLSRARTKAALAACCAILGLGTLIATFTLHKEHALTMEVPRQQYPVAAAQFMREHRLGGKLLVFFDWGEMCLWELPDCSVSIDGRWDTCYPRPLIIEHWRFYNDQPVDKRILDIGNADLALLPANLAGALALKRTFGWKAVYYDDMAVVLVRDLKKYPQLAVQGLPVTGGDGASRGRVPFPAVPSERVGNCHW
jgi:hypothetical protein